MVSVLNNSLSAHLRGELGLADLSDAIRAALADLDAHFEDISSMLNGVPDFLIEIERTDWLKTLTGLQQRLKECGEDLQNQSQIRQLTEDYPREAGELELRAATLREATWSALGPSSHSGVNELLFMIDNYLEGKSNSEELLIAKCEFELERIQHQSAFLHQLPEFMAEAMYELLPELQDHLGGILSSPLEDLDWNIEVNKLEEWASHYSQNDLDFIAKRYSSVPTQIPGLNLALNCQRLFLEELISADLADYAVAQAAEVLTRSTTLFLEVAKLTENDRLTYQETTEELFKNLEVLAEVEDSETLMELGGGIIERANVLIELQKRSEESGGSRLDFKTP